MRHISLLFAFLLLVAGDLSGADKPNVIRVNVTTQQWDFNRPWGKRQPLTRRAIGAVLPGQRVLVTADLVANSTFESGTNGWFFQGNHDRTSLETNAGYLSSKSLHLRASGDGDTGANRIRTRLTASLAAPTTATLRARVRWLRGHPEILLRLHGNWLEATGRMAVQRWTPEFGPLAKLVFSRSAQCEREQIDEAKTENV